jgi:hypothetical protein
VTALRELADELDAAGLRPMATSVLNEAREFSSMQLCAMQRLQTSNDNQSGESHD